MRLPGGLQPQFLEAGLRLPGPLLATTRVPHTEDSGVRGPHAFTLALLVGRVGGPTSRKCHPDWRLRQGQLRPLISATDEKCRAAPVPGIPPGSAGIGSDCSLLMGSMSSSGRESSSYGCAVSARSRRASESSAGRQSSRLTTDATAAIRHFRRVEPTVATGMVMAVPCWFSAHMNMDGCSPADR
jgi:hypothetical protein